MSAIQENEMQKNIILAISGASLLLLGIGIGVYINSNTAVMVVKNEDNPIASSQETTSTTQQTTDQTNTPTTDLTPSATTAPVIPEKIYTDSLDFGVGQGIEWESAIFAPFADVGLWVTDPAYSNSGTLNLRQIMDETGVKYFNLGFINGVDSTVTDGVLNWGFASFDVLSEKHSDNTHYMGIKQSIREVREGGGDVTISIGGLNEGNFFQKTNDLDVLVNTYNTIIDGFDLTRIDLDIEGTAQGYETNKTNAQAIKQVQDQTAVEVVLTLPVLPTGLTTDLGLPTLSAYLDAGVDIVLVNIMTMCYGSYWSDYTQGTIDAIDSTAKQLIAEYERINQPITLEEAYNKIAITTSIGFEGAGHPIFTVDDSAKVVDYCKSVGVNTVSFWSINRDSMTVANEGIYEKYAHTNVYQAFADKDGQTARFLGANNKTIEQGDTFNPLDGVTAYINSENVTANISQTGSVDTNSLGEYLLTYTATASDGTSISTNRTITVVTAQIPQTWSRDGEAAGLYTPGVKVLYQGITYQQVSTDTAWWCEPGTDASIWKEIS